MKTNIQRRKFLLGTAALGFSSVFSFAFSQPENNVIPVIAKKFEYSPNEIRLKVGVPVTLEFTSQDVVMGFNVPDLKIRTDIIPNIKTRLALTPDRVGEFPFYCDIFCGSGHEDMSGVLIVT
jgi:cytochrome c oxidase subunit 2